MAIDRGLHHIGTNPHCRASCTFSKPHFSFLTLHSSAQQLHWAIGSLKRHSTSNGPIGSQCAYADDEVILFCIGFELRILPSLPSFIFLKGSENLGMLLRLLIEAPQFKLKVSPLPTQSTQLSPQHLPFCFDKLIRPRGLVLVFAGIVIVVRSFEPVLERINALLRPFELSEIVNPLMRKVE